MIKFMFRCESSNPGQGVGTSNNTDATAEGEVNYFKGCSRAISHKLITDEVGVITRTGEEASQEKRAAKLKYMYDSVSFIHF